MAAPAAPVAVKVTGEPVSPGLVAVRVLAPAVVPSVQLPTVAMPEALVVAAAPVREPPPEATAKVTATPGTGAPRASVTSTLGGVVTAVPTAAAWPLPADTVMVVGLPMMPVAVKVTGEPLRPALVAVSVLGPGVAPSVQLPTVAMPEALVVAAAPVTEPPPEATAKVTATPETGLLLASVTSTLGGTVTGVPTWTVWPLPAFITILLAAPAAPVAVKVAGEPLRPALAAVSVFVPAVAPSVQLPAAAMPEALVVAAAPVTEPPPETTAKVTATPGTGLLLASVTSTLGAIVTAVPTVAVWPSPAFTSILLGAPLTPVAVKVSGGPARPTAVALRVLLPATAPRVQLPAPAVPSSPVTTVPVPTEPPPDVTVKSTVTPETGLPLPSETITLGAKATAVPATAVWPLPALMDMESELSADVDAWTVVALVLTKEAPETAAVPNAAAMTANAVSI